MDKLKKFLSQKKVDRHFKKGAGHGAKLSDAPSPRAPSVQPGTMQSGSSVDRIHASDVAAQAALKRLHVGEPSVSSSQKKIQMMAQRELEKERRERDSNIEKFKDDIKNLTVNEPEVREFDHSNVIESVKFSCELLGEDVAMPKSQLRSYLESFLREQLAEDAIVPAALLIASLNKSEEARVAKETIAKYVQNILQNPREAKFRRIRLANKAFKDRVEAVKGGREFLEGLGFREKMEAATPGAETEAFLVMDEAEATDEGTLLQALDVLDQATPIPLKVARDTKVFTLKEGEKITTPKLPADFFALSPEELKKEQQTRSVEVDRLTTMRTREMREKDSVQRDYRYKYTLIRIRTPDRLLVQGVFSVHESVLLVREWLHSLLASAGLEFALSDSAAGISGFSDESKSLAALGLVPAALIHLAPRVEWNGPTIADEFLQEALPFSLD